MIRRKRVAGPTVPVGYGVSRPTAGWPGAGRPDQRRRPRISSGSPADDHNFRPIQVVAQHERAARLDHPGVAGGSPPLTSVVSGRNTKGPQDLIIRGSLGVSRPLTGTGHQGATPEGTKH